MLRVLDAAASVALVGSDPDGWLRAVDVQDQQTSKTSRRATDGTALCHTTH